MKEPEISLLMTNYNCGKYIESAIESVINQTYENWELIIVDDKSTDDSLSIINRFLSDKRIKLISRNKNIGYAGSLIDAIKKSKSKIIGIIDSDDALEENAIKVILEEYIKNPNIGLIYSNMWVCDSDLNTIEKSKWVGQVEKGKTNLHRPKVSHFKTFKISVYNKTEGFDINMKKAVDKDIIYKLEEVTKIKYVDKAIYYYRSHDEGISQGKNLAEAKKYSLLAKYKAYIRRKKNGFKNISADEALEIWHKIKESFNNHSYELPID